MTYPTEDRNHRIYWMRVRGEKYKVIAERFGLSKNRVAQICDKIRRERRQYYERVAFRAFVADSSIDMSDPKGVRSLMFLPERAQPTSEFVINWLASEPGRTYDRANVEFDHTLALIADALGCGNQLKPR